MTTPLLLLEVAALILALGGMLWVSRQNRRKRALFRATEPVMRATLKRRFPLNEKLIAYYDHKDNNYNEFSPGQLQGQVDKLVESRNRLFDHWYDLGEQRKVDNITLKILALRTLKEFLVTSNGVDFQDAYTVLSIHYQSHKSPPS